MTIPAFLKSMRTHTITIGGCTRHLPIVTVAEGVNIALFISLGDTEVCAAAARELKSRLPEADILLTAETKGISIAHALSLELGMNRYVVARKSAKPYMHVKLAEDVHTISTQTKQTLYLDEVDVAALEGKRVIIIDDVISTGESLHALESLVDRAGGKLVAKAAILAEGEAKDRTDIVYLDYLPLF